MKNNLYKLGLYFISMLLLSNVSFAQTNNDPIENWAQTDREEYALMPNEEGSAIVYGINGATITDVVVLSSSDPSVATAELSNARRNWFLRLFAFLCGRASIELEVTVQQPDGTIITGTLIVTVEVQDRNRNRLILEERTSIPLVASEIITEENN